MLETHTPTKTLVEKTYSRAPKRCKPRKNVKFTRTHQIWFVRRHRVSSRLQISHQRLGEWSKTPRKSRGCAVLFSGLARIETGVSRYTILLSLEHGNNSRKSSKPKPFWQQQNSKTPETQFFFQSSSCTIYTHTKNNDNFNPSITITTETTTNILLLLQMKANMQEI